LFLHLDEGETGQIDLHEAIVGALRMTGKRRTFVNYGIGTQGDVAKHLDHRTSRDHTEDNLASSHAFRSSWRESFVDGSAIQGRERDSFVANSTAPATAALLLGLVWTPGDFVASAGALKTFD
jgi:hypothetical protein